MWADRKDTQVLIVYEPVQDRHAVYRRTSILVGGYFVQCFTWLQPGQTGCWTRFLLQQ